MSDIFHFIDHYNDGRTQGSIIIAPEGMHRFYISGASGRVGASWMTKEAREIDISDNLSFLEALDSSLSKEFNFEKKYLLGFSQGACLSLEFAARHAQKLGGVVAFTGALIGEELNKEKYTGDFKGAPINISGSVRDIHVPADRMRDSAQLLQDMGAVVSLTFFEDAAHTIRPDELAEVNQKIFL